MFLTGDTARDPGGYALSQVKAVLEAGLVAFAPHGVKLARFGGALITDDPQEATKWVRSKRPFLFLEVADVQEDEVVFRRVVEGQRREGSRWLVEISIEVATNEASSPAEPFLKAAVLDIIRRGYTTLRDAGYEGSSVKAGQGRGQNPERINPHTVSGAVHTIIS